MSEENQTQSALPAPFPWQQAALKEWEKRGRRGIAKVATGSGKTVFALLCAESLLIETRIKIVVPTIALAKQWKSDIASFGISDRIGEWHGDKHSFGDFRFMIYVVDSARYSISTHILSDMRQGKPVLLICDECQHYGSDWNRKIFHFIGAPSFRDDLFYSLGLSATPNCANFDSVLRPCLGDIFFDYDLSAAEKDKLVNPYFLFQIAASFNARERAIYIDLSEKISDMSRQIINTYVVLRTLNGDELFQAIEKKASEGDELCEAYVRLIYKRSGLIRGANSRLECIADLVPSLPADKRIIIFSERIEQADALKEALTKRGITRVRIYHSEMDEATKKTALEDFRLGEARILLCCKALDEGLNVPDADVGIVLSSTKSDRQRIQRLGRVLRVAEGKEPARLYYVYIQGTNDLSAYLGGNLSASEVIDVTYYDGGFDCDEYFELADRLLKALQFPSDLSGRAKYREFRRCLDKGVIRGDYFLPPDYLRKKKEESLFAEEKNYYHAMALLSELRVKEKAKKS